MNGAPYQFCASCKEERLFKWTDGFTLECKTCGHTERPSVQDPVKFAAMKIEGNNNHLSLKESEQLFSKLIDPFEMKDEVKPEILFDVKGGVATALPKQGRDVKHTPIEFKSKGFPTSVNLEIFLKGGSDD